MRGYHAYKDILKLFQNYLIRLRRYLQNRHSIPCGRRALIRTVTPSVVLKRPACTASLVDLIEAEESVSDNGPFGSGNCLKYR